MPLTLLVVGAAILVSYHRGGRFHRIPEAGLRWSWALFAGLALQVAVDAAAGRGLLEGSDGYVVLLGSQLLVVSWVAANPWRPGMPLILIGLLMNAVVMGANGAMPVDPAAIAQLGIGDVEVPPGKHVLMSPSTRLSWLADIFPLPLMRTIISIGDIVLTAGLIPLTHHLMTFEAPSVRRGGRRRAEAPDMAPVG